MNGACKFMKKNKIIALALAAAITSMGAGYAAWQDSVTIQSQVKTGSLDVRFCNSGDLPSASVDPKNSYVTVDNPEIINDGKLLKINASNFYPSKDITTGILNDRKEIPALEIAAGIINAGSIPAKINGVTVSREGSEEIYNKIRVEKAVLCKVYNNDKYVLNIFTNKWVLLDENYISKLEVQAELNSIFSNDDMTLEQFQQFLNISIGNDYVLGDTSTIFIGSLVKINADSIRLEPRLRLYIHESAGNETQDKNCTVNIKFNWKQFNQ